jgi:TonB family protein
MRHFLAALLITASATQAAQSAGDRIPPADILKEVRPEYPLEARRKHEVGSGVLILHVDRKTGEVTSVTIRKSTGYKVLDDAGLKAFRQWRFRPGTVTEPIWMPISFSLPHRT